MASRWWFLPIKEGNVRALTLMGLFNATSEGGGPLAAPMTLDSLLSIEQGDARGAWVVSVLAQTVSPRTQVAGDAAATATTPHPYRKPVASRAGRHASRDSVHAQR